jgi:uncharacterized protein
VKAKDKLKLISIKPGEEVLSSISEQAGSLGIENGAIVSLIGAVDSCGIVNMPENDPFKEVRSEINIPVQLTGTGEIVDGKAHIHCIVTGEDHTGFGGHLLWARVESWFVHAYVVAME